MKKTFFILSMAMLMAGTTFTACQTPAQKEAAEQKKADEEQAAIEATRQDINSKEWLTLKASAQERISNNETRIAEIRAKLKTSGKTMDALRTKRIETLEQRNRDIRSRMDSYDSNPSDWETFKAEFNRELDDLSKSVDDFINEDK
jgi:septal ring factor EnvC (AmiA/AmiB activator)